MGGVYTHIYESVDVSRLEIPQDGSFVEVGEIGHVFALFEFWRVHLSHGFRFVDFFGIVTTKLTTAIKKCTKLEELCLNFYDEDYSFNLMNFLIKYNRICQR